MKLVGDFDVLGYGHQRLKEEVGLLLRKLMMERKKCRSEVAPTSRAALASSHFSARPEMVMMSHLRGTNSASRLTSPFSCGGAS